MTSPNHPFIINKPNGYKKPSYAKWIIIGCLLVFSGGLALSLYTEDDVRKLETLTQKMENKGLTENEQQEFCRLKSKIDGIDYEDCISSFKKAKPKKGKASTKDEKKINSKRSTSHQHAIDSLNLLLKASKYPPLTKKEKNSIKTQITHHRRQQRKPEPHGRKGKRK